MILASARLRITTPANRDIDRHGGLQVYRTAAGEIDGSVDVALFDEAVPAWPAELTDRRGGWGNGWGLGWGIQDPAGGWGDPWGRTWGHDLPSLQIVTPALDDGSYRLAVHPIDGAGNENATPTAYATAVVAGVPAAPSEPSAAAETATTLELTWTASSDDLLA